MLNINRSNQDPDATIWDPGSGLMSSIHLTVRGMRLRIRVFRRVESSSGSNPLNPNFISLFFYQPETKKKLQICLSLNIVEKKLNGENISGRIQSWTRVFVRIRFFLNFQFVKILSTGSAKPWSGVAVE